MNSFVFGHIVLCNQMLNRFMDAFQSVFDLRTTPMMRFRTNILCNFLRGLTHENVFNQRSNKDFVLFGFIQIYTFCKTICLGSTTCGFLNQWGHCIPIIRMKTNEAWSLPSFNDGLNGWKGEVFKILSSSHDYSSTLIISFLIFSRSME